MTNTISTFPNLNIYDLEELTFIGSSYRELNFHIYDVSGSLQDISQISEAYWDLVPYGHTDYVALSKTGVINGTYFTIYLDDSDTQYLSGKYIQRPGLCILPGWEYKLGQGIINIIPRIGAI